jgi:uncharacterized protein YcaQ
MRTETLPMKKVTRFYLINHHLFQKARRQNLEDVIGNVCGLHAQAAATPYLSLWNRVEGFEDDLLDKALYRDKTLVKVWCMRGTLHVIPSLDLPVYNRALRTMWFEHHGRFMRAPDYPLKEERKKLIYPKIVQALAAKPLKRKELNAKVQALLKDNSKPYQRLFSGWGGILKETAYEGLTVHAEPCEREACFARVDKWLPHISLDKVNEEEAQEKLLIKYLSCYGPATAQDFCLWSGLMASDAKKAIENLKDSLLEEVKIEGAKGLFLLLKQDLKQFDPISLDEKTQPRLLPKFDPYVLGHKDRRRIINDEHKKRVFRKAGDIAATLLLNGRIMGTWTHKKAKNSLSLTVASFRRLAKDELRQVEEEARELSQFMGAAQLKLSFAS